MNARLQRAGRAGARTETIPGKNQPRDATGVPTPMGLQASTIELVGDQYLVLSFPIPTWSLPANLTAAERGVATALLHGLDRAEIARVRGTSPRTIANQIASLFEKLGVQSRIELAVFLSRARGEAETHCTRRATSRRA
jgi:DNA-binding CsgD family transcriptional regulator